MSSRADRPPSASPPPPSNRSRKRSTRPTPTPRHLKGRRIPLSARIVAIADTFDAITHRRRYRGGSSAEKAKRAILEGRGTEFDPELVDLFTFPPVFTRILETERTVARWREPV